ncbi:anthranilate/para-aminobenzoate synthase component I [Mycetocola sp. BIGb0189]|uniref:anthranilate synthase component I family protein n=1 Tax=Mycetocola sp. BIGb0189 TaxID=2940604 RepID=UPI0021688D53|nr:anthranilate synthase component I family protein [Mycetocola sp. BIGb0189]MCS4276020.1 anthranilate/para-aminobenzoate synthase component I [Mycetocola sp. BIGb0189]
MNLSFSARVLPGWVEPDAVAEALIGDTAFSFWLDAGAGAEAGPTYLGIASTVVTADRSAGTVCLREGTCDPSLFLPAADLPDLHAVLESVLDRFPAIAADVSGFGGGWIGFLGYEYGTDLVGAPAAASRPGALPDAGWMLVDRMLAFDHGARTVTLIERTDLPTDPRWENPGAGAGAGAAARVPASADHAAQITAPAAGAPPVPTWRHSEVEYRALVERCRTLIAAGEAYQLCLTNEVIVPGAFDPLALYQHLRTLSPTDRGGYLRFEDTALVSSSPETFLSVDTVRRVTTRPVKGTRRRDADPIRDAELAAEVRADEKERAENLMIVDLMRNDLGRIAVLGSVTVSELHVVETYSQVHQLVSTVEATMRPDVHIGDLLRTTFPAGSMTGAPKHRAMTHLAAMEAGPRGAYAGAFGYRDARGSLELSMIIRSILVEPGCARIGAGGGITILSDPGREYAESRLKARVLLAALGVAETDR